jgi:hypothetical protein
MSLPNMAPMIVAAHQGSARFSGKRTTATFTAVTQKLIANLAGISFGPRLPNRRDTLVVVTDDNFPTADSATD